jgi:Domain of Unknown Function (DUF1080)
MEAMRIISIRSTTLLAIVGAALFGCSPESGSAKAGADTGAAAATVAAAEAAKARREAPLSNTVIWTPLIDSTMSQWRAWKAGAAMPTGWSVVEGVLTKSAEVGDLQSRLQYANFELEFDWMLAEEGNSGVFYRVTEEYDAPYWSAPEYQLLDDAHQPPDVTREQSAGSAYALYATPLGVVKPANQWNSARIVVAGKFVEHWLNGQQVVQYTLSSPDWAAKVKASKFGAYPNYGLAQRGYLAIQGDHKGQLSIRGMRIRELP